MADLMVGRAQHRWPLLRLVPQTCARQVILPAVTVARQDVVRVVVLAALLAPRKVVRGPTGRPRGGRHHRRIQHHGGDPSRRAASEGLRPRSRCGRALTHRGQREARDSVTNPGPPHSRSPQGRVTPGWSDSSGFSEPRGRRLAGLGVGLIDRHIQAGDAQRPNLDLLRSRTILARELDDPAVKPPLLRGVGAPVHAAGE